MTTTEIIEILKKNEFGGASGRPREVYITIGEEIYETDIVSIDSGDGLFAELFLNLSADPKMKKMKVYTSGKITGNPFYKADFENAAKEMEEAGHEPINPVSVYGEGTCSTYKEYIDRDMELLAGCDGIYMLKGWEDSPGARLEHQYAVTTGMWIAYQ